MTYAYIWINVIERKQATAWNKELGFPNPIFWCAANVKVNKEW
jgi:hypothetical protein